MPRTLGPIAVWSGAGAFLLLVGVLASVDRWGYVTPPLPGSLGELLTVAPVAAPDGTTRLGSAFTVVRAGLRAASVSGSAAARGIAWARLCPRELGFAEDARMTAAVGWAPQDWLRWGAFRWLWLRHWPRLRDLPGPVKEEIAGLVHAAPDGFPAFGQAYARWLVLAAIPEVVQDRSGEQAGDAAFCVRASAAGSGTPWLACSLAPGLGPEAARGLIVLQVRPEHGFAFLSLAWPGQVGVLSGLNTAGVGVVVMGVRSAARSRDGLPASLLARRILEEAGSLEQAVALASAVKTSTAAVFVLGSGTQNAFTAVEKTPDRTVVRAVTAPAASWVDWFSSPELRADPDNLRYAASGPPGARSRRLHALVEAAAGPWDVARAVAVLRDRRGTDGNLLAFGHPAAIESCTAAVAAVWDLRGRQVWVSQGPHALGAFVPFAVDDPARAVAAAPVAADPALARGSYRDLERYRAGLRAAAGLIRAGRFREGLARLLDVRPLVPDDYRNYLLAGRALEALGLADEARFNYAEARRRNPAWTREREELDLKLRRLSAVNPS